MKRFFLIPFVLGAAFGLEPLSDYWSFDTGNLYYIDWAKPGFPKETREEILNSMPKKIGSYYAPLAVQLGYWGSPDIIRRKIKYQAVVSIQYKNNATKKRKRVLVWVGRNCELEYFGGSQAKQDTLIYWIKMAAPKSIQDRILTSKKCNESLARTIDVIPK
jgi:hypothetical protein